MFSAPVPITSEEDASEFSCGESSLDSWLKRRALKNQFTGATRTFVLCESGKRIAAYYALASSAIAVGLAAGRFRRNMPDPIPVVVLARLAVDQRYQGHGLGRAMVRDAALRIVGAADTIGIRGVIVHALSESARRFYERVGFDPSPLDQSIWMITLTDLRAILADG
jgi:GNAT superfamily N-acetyltransferase